MALAKNNRGQSSVEFVAIVGVMFFVLMGTLLVIQDKMADAQRSRIYEASNSLGNLISSEVRLAESVKGDYSREFFIPFEIAGYNYSISLPASTEIVISMENIDYVVFLDRNVSGTIGKGRNVVTKDDDNITIKNIQQPTFCLFGAGTDDPACGHISCYGWYVREGIRCYNKKDITGIGTDPDNMRCEGIDDCKDSNSEDCNAQDNYHLQYTCGGSCEYLASDNCVGTFRGECTKKDAGDSCPMGHCDGNGNCVP
jgi:hypothetical protein